MNDMLVGILGLAAIAATVISLTRGKMLPVYRRMRMRETTLLRIGIVCMGAKEEIRPFCIIILLTIGFFI